METYHQKLSLPPIGFGTADLSTPVEEAVWDAVRCGYRLIDTAPVYGSEEGVGKAIRRAEECGLANRSELLLETKLPPNRHGYYEAFDSLNESLERLQTDYIDVYLIHWPVPRGDEETYREKNIAAWQAFEEMKKQRKVRHIGVCNFLERHLLQLMESGLSCPEINQLELHPGFQQRGLVRFCKERGILIEAWSPMGRGLLQTPEFEAMAASYGKTSGQLALRWSVQKSFLPLSRSSSRVHMEQNLQIFDFQIRPADLKKLDALNTPDNHQDIWSYRRQQMY